MLVYIAEKQKNNSQILQKIDNINLEESNAYYSESGFFTLNSQEILLGLNFLKITSFN